MKSKIVDMTQGSPMKHLLAFTWPLLIGNVFQQFYNMVDSVIVGNFVGPAALAAVGTCGSFGFLFFSLAGGLATGIGILVSQYFGAKNERALRATIANSFFILTVSSFAVTVIGVSLCRAILRLISCPESILPDAALYLRLTTFGIIFIAFYNGISSILRALGDSKTPLYFLILASLVNVVLDLLFVVYFGWAVLGVALATVISQAVSAVACLIYAFAKVPYFRFSRKDLRPDTTIVARSFRIGIPVALQSSLIAISCIMLQGVVNSFGEIVMATFTVASRLEQLIHMPFQSLAAAITTYAGQNYGAQNIDRVRKGMHRGIFLVAALSLLLVPVVFVFGRTMIAFFVKDRDVIEMGYVALKLTCFFYFPLGMIYIPRASLNGCGDANFAMMNGLVEVVCRILFAHVLASIASITLFGHTFPIGYWGVWLTNSFTWTVTAIVCVWRYKFGKWRTTIMTGEF